MPGARAGPETKFRPPGGALRWKSSPPWGGGRYPDLFLVVEASSSLMYSYPCVDHHYDGGAFPFQGLGLQLACGQIPTTFKQYGLKSRQWELRPSRTLTASQVDF